MTITNITIRLFKIAMKWKAMNPAMEIGDLIYVFYLKNMKKAGL